MLITQKSSLVEGSPFQEVETPLKNRWLYRS